MYAQYSKYKTNTQKKIIFSPFFPLDNHKKQKNMEKISSNRKNAGAQGKRVIFFVKNDLQKKEKQTIISGKRISEEETAMKKILSGIVFALMLFAGMELHAQWVDKVTLYVPNRILDLLDVFSLDIGGGPAARAELRFTHAAQVGGGFGYTANLVKDTNRQYGYAMQNGWSGFLPGIAAEDTERRPTSSLVQEYWVNMEGFPNPAEPIYDLRKGARDYWEIGGTLGLGLIEARVSIHPVDILDAVLGFFFIDIKGDDLTFENFK